MSTKQPNIVFIITHDSGRHFGCYGHSTVETPNIDALAAEGALLRNLISTCSICSPSRASVFTGRYPQHNGVMGLTHDPFNWRLNPGERHASHIFHDAGYQTALIGHRHETMHADRDCMFDVDLAYTDDATGFYTTAPQVAESTENHLDGIDTDRPFYLQVGFFETHRSYYHGGLEPRTEEGVEIPDYIEDTPEAREDFAMLQASLTAADTAVGRILKKLEEKGVADNTLVVFTTDHGLDVPGAKHSMHRQGIEVAGMMRMPGRIQPGTRVDALLSNVDLLPTALDLAGIECPKNLDGHSIIPVIEKADKGRDAAFSEYTSTGKGGRSIITDRYHLIWNYAQGRTPKRPVKISKNPPVENPAVFSLYDLKNDPQEFNNLADDPAHAETFKVLREQLLQWLRDVNDPVLDGPVATPRYQSARQSLEG